MRVWAILLAFVIPCLSVHAADPQTVQTSIDHAKAFLYKDQKPNGSWEESETPTGDQAWTFTGGQFGGRTAMAVYALLASGEANQDPRLVRAIDWLRKLQTEGTFVLGIRCNIWLHLPQTAENRESMRADLKKLLTAQKTQGEGKGMFDFVNSGPAGNYGHARSEYPILGVWAAAQYGLEVPAGFWESVEAAWKDHQDASGGWAYKKKPTAEEPVTIYNTAHGIASLFITLEQLHSNEGIQCKGNPRSEPIEKAMKYIAEHFDDYAADRPGKRDYSVASLYAIERIGVASGLQAFNGVDWFDKGCQYLFKKQEADGSWKEPGMGPAVGTSFGILFLSRGRAPLALSKLDFTTDPKKPASWNQRPRDAAAVTRWIGRQLERELNWQIVTLGSSLETLQESPILYLTGSGEARFSPGDVEKLRAYVLRGGMLLANADCGNSSFTTSIRRLSSQLFPDYEFRELEQDHPIYTRQQYPRQKWKTKPMVLAMGNGVREFIILLPAVDAGRAWQLQDPSSKPELWELASNLVLYSVDKQFFRFRGDRAWIAPDESIQAEKSITITRLRYDGNWDPEPLGWQRLAAWMQNQEKCKLDIKTARLGTEPIEGKIAHLTGTTRFKLTEPQKQALKAFLDGGGSLVIDSAGGNAQFAEQIEAEIPGLLGQPLQPLAEGHAVYPESVALRSFARERVTGPASRLQGITLAGRLAVVYSREDLSAGIGGCLADGISGYTPDTSVALLNRILQYLAGDAVK